MWCQSCGVFAPYVTDNARCIDCGGELRLSADDLLDDSPKKIVDEVRPAQVKMAQAVEEAILLGHNLIAEAGTGTGKSFAVLLPAILSGKRAVVSTATTLLQHQYNKFALDFLERKLEPLGIEVTYAVAKGKRHYLCPKLFKELKGKLKPYGGFKTAKQKEVHKVFEKWAANTESGDREELDEVLRSIGAIAPDYFSDVTAEDCTGAKTCAVSGTCGYVRARAALQDAMIIIANHMIVGLNAKVGGRILPRHSVYIMDEAHKAEEYFRKAFGSSLSQTTIRNVLRKVENATPSDDIIDGALEDLKHINDSLFEHASLAFRGDSGSVVVSADTFEDDLNGANRVLERMQARMTQLIEQGSNEDEDREFLDDLGVDPETRLAYQEAKEVAAAALKKHAFGEIDDSTIVDVPAVRNALARVERLRGTLLSIKEDTNGSVLYIEKYFTKKRDPRYQLVRSPVMLGDILRSTLYSQVKTVIQTSATMSVAGDFGFYKEAMGLDEDTRTYTAPSPFDYRGRTMLYLPTHLPIHPNNQQPRPLDREAAMEEYSDAMAKEIARLVNISKGCAFVLFSARGEMQESFERVKDMVRYPCRVQEEGISTGTLETWFKEETRPVLFATKSFWEGISVEGKQLRMVIIPKVPFPSPADPIMDEKKKIVIERHGEKAWFMKLYFPVMVMDVLQGLGRLMRRNDDFGVAAILDTRVIPGAPGAKYYGKKLVASLPFTNATHDIDRIRMCMEAMEKGMGPF